MQLGNHGVQIKTLADSWCLAPQRPQRCLAQALLWLLPAVSCCFWGGAAHATLAGPLCGNGVIDMGETCDDGNADEGDACLSDCQPASCGDGFIQRGVEQCDDGNAVQSDGCSTRCTVGYCGDGILQSQDGEQCDDENTIDGDGCSSECQRQDGGARNRAPSEDRGRD